MNQKTKIVLTATISIIVTFALTSALYLSIGGGILSKIATQNTAPKSSSSASNALLTEVKAYLEKNYIGDIDEDKLYRYAAKGMAESVGDKYTEYYTPDEFKEYMEDASGEYVGVGIVVSSTIETNELIAVMPYEDAPGDKAGVLPGDIIIAVDGVPYTGDMVDEAAEAMRGTSLANPEGTQVTVTLRRNGGEPFDLVITREQVHLKTVSSKMLEGDIGYMRIISFDSDTDVEADNAIKSLTQSGMKKLIIDLRDNGGGDFNTSLGVAGKFLDEGTLAIYTQDKNGKRQDYMAEGKISDCEIIMLINGNTASASEVLTGALMGNNRLKSVVGTKSYGKGITQNIYQLKNGGGMSITVDRYYTPTDECIHEKGIMPDTEVSLGENEDTISTMLTYEQDLQLQKAVEMFR